MLLEQGEGLGGRDRVFDPAHLAGKQRARQEERHVERPGEARRQANQAQQRHHHGQRAADRHPCPWPEEKGGGMHAGPLVIFLVLQGVDRVVANGPEDGSDEEADGWPGDLVAHGRPGHDRAPPERRAQDGLGERQDPFGQRVQDCQEQRDGRQGDREGVEQEDQGGGDPDQRKKDGHGRSRLHAAGRKGTLAGALDPPVQVTVPEVVDRDPRAPHDKHARHEDSGQREWRVPVTGEDQRP